MIYAKPTNTEIKVWEVLNKVSSTSPIEEYNSNNVKLGVNDYIGTGNKLKTNEKYYAMIIIGDTTGDTKIELGDVSKLYNFYRGNKKI
jgi:sorbitol-specific phosphotransferase system component IIA